MNKPHAQPELQHRGAAGVATHVLAVRGQRGLAAPRLVAVEPGERDQPLTSGSVPARMTSLPPVPEAGTRPPENLLGPGRHRVRTPRRTAPGPLPRACRCRRGSRTRRCPTGAVAIVIPSTPPASLARTAAAGESYPEEIVTGRWPGTTGRITGLRRATSAPRRCRRWSPRRLPPRQGFERRGSGQGRERRQADGGRSEPAGRGGVTRVLMTSGPATIATIVPAA